MAAVPVRTVAATGRVPSLLKIFMHVYYAIVANIAAIDVNDAVNGSERSVVVGSGWVLKAAISVVDSFIGRVHRRRFAGGVLVIV